MNCYYEIWVDVIDKAKNTNNGKSSKDKMITLLVAFSIAQGFNLVTIYFIISYFIRFNPLIGFDIFPGKYLDIALSGFISFYLPFFVINYFLIFYKKKYERLLDKRKLNSGGKAFVFYFFGSGIIFFLTIFLGKLL
ncbi:MAG: hypothetical protein GX587_02905 [Bacteroidales bacterium]|nr:hypothetical protein [Bacteroidales bacterium]